MKKGNKLVALILAGCILMSGSGMKVMATDEPGQETPSSENAGDAGGYRIDSETIASTSMPITEEALEKQMEAQLALTPETNNLQNWPEGPMVTADAAIVMDVNSGQILYGKQVNKKEYPASITKIMTALLALENGDLQTDKVLFSQECIDFLERGDAYIGMTPGEEISLKDAMYGMLLASANEVSYAIAENIGEKLGIGYDGFINKMTERAKELGCENTHFMNANGLHDENHYVSAKDMALIASAAYQFEEFRNIIQTYEYTIPETNLMNETRTFQQNHKMISQGNQFYYESCTGGKTGYTDQARTTLVSYAEKQGMQLVCVVLRTRGAQAYTDTQELFEYAFNNFQKIYLKDKEKPKEVKEIPDDAYVILPKEVPFEDVEMKLAKPGNGGEKGIAAYFYHDTLVGKAEVTIKDEYRVNTVNDSEEKAEGASAKASKELPLWMGVVFGIVGTVVVLLVIVYICVRRAKEKRRRMIMRKRQAKRRAEQKRREQEQMEQERMERERAARYRYMNPGGYYRNPYVRNDRINQNRNPKNRKW